LLLALAAALAPVSGAAPAAKVIVPNVVGRLQSPAQAQLRRAHLRPSVVHVHSLQLVGTVVAEKPRGRGEGPNRLARGALGLERPRPLTASSARDEPPGRGPAVRSLLGADSVYGTDGGASSSTVG
jgi:hypothetical protein